MEGLLRCCYTKQTSNEQGVWKGTLHT